MYTLPFKPDDKIVELGGGSNPLFHPNYDIRKLTGVDFVIDFNNLPLPIPNESYDGVLCKYVLEHLSWRRSKAFLSEIYRILGYGGIAVIVTANLLEQARVVVNSTSDKWDSNLLGLVFGDQGYENDEWIHNAHYSGFSPEYLTRILKEVGFRDIKITPINSDFGPTDMFVQAIKPNNTIKAKVKAEIKTDNIKTYSENIDRRQWILNKCKVGEKILDIGSANGWIFKNTQFSQYVTGIDLDIYDIPSYQLFRQMDAHRLEFPDKSFDTVILGELLEHVENPVQVLREANRVGKRILMTIPDEINWSPENYPFETLEQAMKRRNLTLEQIVKVSNPDAKELYTKDNHKHLFHNRYYIEDTLKQELKDAGIIDYEMTRLQYGIPKWSFFVIETKDKEIGRGNVVDIMTVNNTLPVKRMPVITTGPIIRDEIKEEIRKDKLKIALISTPFFTLPPKGYGGLEQVVWDLAECLDKSGHEITIFAPEGSKIPPHGHLVVTGPSISTVNVNWFEEERNRYEIYKDIICDKKFDVIHDHTWFAFAYLSKMNNPELKVIHTHHGSMNWETQPPFPKPNLVAISDFMRQYTIRYFNQRGYNVDCQYVHNGIDLDKYPFDPNIKRTNRLLYVGRFSKFKQPDVAIQVAKRANLPIDLIGGTFIDDINYLKEIESMCNGNNIVIYKDADHYFKIKKMQEAMCLIFPSKMGEPLGLVAQEAMACGTPVIATRDGAISEIVLHNQTGFICNTEEEMVEAIKNIDKIDQLECRNRAILFSRENMAENYVKLYQKMMKGEDW